MERPKYVNLIQSIKSMQTSFNYGKTDNEMKHHEMGAKWNIQLL